MNTNNDNDLDGKIEIVELDETEGPRRTRPATQLQHQTFRPWLRWSLTLLIIASSVALLTTQIRNISQSVSNLWPAPAPTPTLSPGLQRSGRYVSLLPANGLVYTTLFNDDNRHGTLSALHDSNGSLLWRYKGNIISPPQMIDDVLYIVTDTGVDALRASNRSLLWHSNQPIAFIQQVQNGVVYAIRQSDQTLIALRSSNGALLWHHPSIVDLFTSDGVIYTHSETSPTLYALRASDGKQLWQYHYDRPRQFSISAGGDVVCIRWLEDRSPGPGLDVLRASDGSLLWHSDDIIYDLNIGDNDLLYTTSSINISFSTPTSDRPGIEIKAHDIRTGTVRWLYTTSDIDLHQIVNGVLYLGNVQGQGTGALRLSDGKLLWQNKTISGQISLVNNDQVCVWINQADSHGIACVRTADGSLLWEHIICTLSCDLYTQVVEMTNIFYISEQQGGAVGDEKTTITLHALRMSDGQQLWRYQIDSNSSVITEGTSVYINFPQDRSVVALNAATGDVRWRYKMQA